MNFPRTILGIMVLLALFEIGLEYRAYKRGYSTLLFGATGEKTDNPGSAANDYGPTPSFPFRSWIVSQNRPSDVFRLWLASASHAEDNFLPAETIFPNLISSELSPEGIQVQVLNASRAGSSIAENTERLVIETQNWQPDIAILYSMSLDISILCSAAIANQDAISKVEVIKEGPELDNSKKRPNVFIRLYERTTIYAVFKEFMGGRIAQQRILLDDLGPVAQNSFRDLITDFITNCRMNDIEPVLCTFATSHDSASISQLPQSYKSSLFRYNIYLSIPGWMKTVDDYNRLLREIASDSNVLLVDLAREIGGHPEYFRDFIHFSPQGHQAMATNIASALKQSSIIKSGSTGRSRKSADEF